jgi:hypothetical protein
LGSETYEEESGRDEKLAVMVSFLGPFHAHGEDYDEFVT